MRLPRFAEQALAFAAAYERPLGAVLFVFGFLTDIFTFGLLPLGVVNLFFVSYLALAAVCTFGTHLLSAWSANAAWWRKVLSVLFPLGAQYALGGLLSGFVVFYAKSSVVAVSWPFLLLLALVYGGNEYFRKHREHLVFQTVLFFFALYAYAIFALPLFVHALGPWTFLGSTALSAAAFGLFLLLLKLVNAPRYRESRPPILAWGAGILLVVNALYFTGLIPPIPLALTHADAYQELSRTEGGYLVRTEAPRAWWDILPRTLHHVPGTPLYVFTAVKAPVSFAATVTHEWEHREQGAWVPKGRISFPITGGRADGYRGYSFLEDPAPGDWRVTVKTAGGQVIGRLAFTVENVDRVVLLSGEIL